MRVDDDRVTNFGYFLRFVMRKKKLRAAAVASLLGWDATYVENLMYGTVAPPSEGEVERLIHILQCEGADADALRLFSSGEQFVSLRRQLDERTAELFEKKAALEEKEKSLEALRAKVERLEAEIGCLRAERPGSDAPQGPPGDTTRLIDLKAARKIDRFAEEVIEFLGRATPDERLLLALLVRPGLVGKLLEALKNGGWVPPAAAAPIT